MVMRLGKTYWDAYRRGMSYQVQYQLCKQRVCVGIFTPISIAFERFRNRNTVRLAFCPRLPPVLSTIHLFTFNFSTKRLFNFKAPNAYSLLT